MDSEQIPIFLELSSDVQQALGTNGLSIEGILREQDIAANVTYGVLPDSDEPGSLGKEPVLIILASAAAVLAIGTAISTVLHAVYRKPYLIDYYELEELRDAEGNVLMGEDGEPRFKRVKKLTLLEPRQENNTLTSEVSLDPKKRIVVKFGSSQEQFPSGTRPGDG